MQVFQIFIIVLCQSHVRKFEAVNSQPQDYRQVPGFPSSLLKLHITQLLCQTEKYLLPQDS